MRPLQKVAIIPPEAEKDLSWWHIQLPMHHCSPIVHMNASVVKKSDASLKGWGANCKRMRMSGVTLECEQSLMPHQPPGVEGSLLGNPMLPEGEIRSECGNRTAIAYLNHMRASMNPR